MSAALRLFAPAKVNLFLHVICRRADGYHELESLIVFADIGDTLSVIEAPDLSLTLEGPFAPLLADEPLDTNLVHRAALQLREKAAAGGGAPRIAPYVRCERPRIAPYVRRERPRILADRPRRSGAYNT